MNSISFHRLEDALDYAKKVGGKVEIQFLPCGQKDYVVTYYSKGGDT